MGENPCRGGLAGAGVGSSPFSLETPPWMLLSLRELQGDEVWVGVGCHSLTHPSLVARALLMDPGDLDADGSWGVWSWDRGCGAAQQPGPESPRKMIMQKMGSEGAAEWRICLGLE